MECEKRNKEKRITFAWITGLVPSSTINFKAEDSALLAGWILAYFAFFLTLHTVPLTIRKWNLLQFAGVLWLGTAKWFIRSEHFSKECFFFFQLCYPIVKWGKKTQVKGSDCIMNNCQFPSFSRVTQCVKGLKRFQTSFKPHTNVAWKKALFSIKYLQICYFLKENCDACRNYPCPQSHKCEECRETGQTWRKLGSEDG